MRFGPTAAQEDLRDEVRALLAQLSPPSEVRRLMETEAGYDREAWSALAARRLLGDLGWVERCVVLEEAGRVLLCAPYLATVTAARFLPEELQHDVAAGRCIATLAIAEPTGRWDEAGVATRAVPSAGGGWRVEGTKSYVVDGCAADVFVVAARLDGDVRLFVVDATAPGVDRSPLATVDQTRKQAMVRLGGAPARAVPGTLDAAVDLSAVALAAEQVGGAGRCL
ncbi:MAG: acyl-CoA dehydrogenase family protein, partial [Actinomycetota bacterium]|nr:acyl-CoA dehydrogenase family protein [Actinomycetota bacterium]